MPSLPVSRWLQSCPTLLSSRKSLSSLRVFVILNFVKYFFLGHVWRPEVDNDVFLYYTPHYTFIFHRCVPCILTVSIPCPFLWLLVKLSAPIYLSSILKSCIKLELIEPSDGCPCEHGCGLCTEAGQPTGGHPTENSDCPSHRSHQLPI